MCNLHLVCLERRAGHKCILVFDGIKTLENFIRTVLEHFVFNTPFLVTIAVVRSVLFSWYIQHTFIIAFMTLAAMSSPGSSGEGESWIHWFVQLPGHSWLTAVDNTFIEDAFNLYGLRVDGGFSLKECLEVILGPAPADPDSHRSSSLYTRLKRIYGLIHARFITTSRGLTIMASKLEECEFGRCPRLLCYGAPVVPMGMSNDPGHSCVNVFCSRCQDVFVPAGRDMSSAPEEWNSLDHDDSSSVRFSATTSDSADMESRETTSLKRKYGVMSSSSNSHRRSRRHSLTSELDGAFFGPTFPHLLLALKSNFVLPKTKDAYVPRIYGFKVHSQRGRAPLTVADATADPAGDVMFLYKEKVSLSRNRHPSSKPLTSSYTPGCRPPEDDFISSSEEEAELAHAAKKARTASHSHRG